MLRRVLIACAVLLAFASFSAAEAGVPIPCTATYYLKAPDVSRASTRGVALYYAVDCFGGRWDGYRTADGKYVMKLPESLLSSLPKPPGFWASAWEHKLTFWVEWFWIFLGAFVVMGSLLAKYAEVYGGDVVANPPVNPRTVRRR
jgi:hypothetical protein